MVKKNEKEEEDEGRRRSINIIIVYRYHVNETICDRIIEMYLIQ